MPADRVALAWERHRAATVPEVLAPADPGDTLVRRWLTTWAAAPARPVLGTADGRWISAEQLEQRTRATAIRLVEEAGVQPGDRVALALPSSIELIEWHVGILRAGAVSLPCNPAYRQRELAQVIADSQATAVVVARDEQAQWCRAARPGIRVVDVRRPGAPASGHTGADLDRAAPSDPALLCYTSGTTGTPKGALLTHRNVHAGARSLVEAWGWNPDDRLLMALPLFHMHGLGVATHGTLLAGASAVIYEGFDAHAVLGGIADHRASLVFGVPTMYAKLASTPGVDALGNLRLCVSGSAPLAEGLHRAIEAASGQRILERYGLTETVINLSNPLRWPRKAGSVGFELPDVEVRLSQGDSGEIQVKGPNVFQGYLDREDATRDAFTDDGWFKTGDLATIDDDGYYTIVGRSKELIISGGYNVYPREIEDVLTSMEGVHEAAVVGTPSDQWGEVVTAYVVGEADALTAADVEAFCAERLVPYKQPRIIRFVDSLPRNALGKIVREALRD